MRCEGSGLPPELVTQRSPGYGAVPTRGICRKCKREFSLTYNRTTRVRRHQKPHDHAKGSEIKG